MVYESTQTVPRTDVAILGREELYMIDGARVVSLAQKNGRSDIAHWIALCAHLKAF